MEVKAILELKRNPFQEDILNDDEKEGVTMKDKVRFYLCLAYYQKFFSLVGISLQLPIDLLFLNKKSMNINYRDCQYFVEQKEAINRILFKEIMNWSSWSYDKMEIDEDYPIKNESNVESYLVDSLSNCNELGICDDAEWKKMILTMPQLCIDSKETLTYVTVFVCWNKKLASYLNFRKYNSQTVEKTFSDGDHEILRILQAICDPLSIKTGLDYTELVKDRYILGFFEGSNDDYSISFYDLHMHFGINIIILELFLNAAVQIFGL